MAFGFQPAGLFGRKPFGRKPLTGQGIMPGDQPDYGMGDFPSHNPGAQPDVQQAAKPQGMFGKITGAMGDIGAILDDEPSPQEVERDQQRFAEQQYRARALAEQQMAEAKRDQDWQDYMRKYQFELDHPKPEAPDAFERALRGAGIDPASEQGVALYRGRAESMARDPNDEFVVVPIPGVGTYAGPRSGLSEAMGGGQQRKLGPVVDSIPGGPQGKPAGTFPRY